MGCDEWLGIAVSPDYWDLAGSSGRLEKMTMWKAEQMASVAGKIHTKHCPEHAHTETLEEVSWDGDLEPLAHIC